MLYLIAKRPDLFPRIPNRTPRVIATPITKSNFTAILLHDFPLRLKRGPELLINGGGKTQLCKKLKRNNTTIPLDLRTFEGAAIVTTVSSVMVTEFFAENHGILSGNTVHANRFNIRHEVIVNHSNELIFWNDSKVHKTNHYNPATIPDKRFRHSVDT